MLRKTGLLLFALIALLLASCDKVMQNLGGMKMDSPEVLEKAKELAKSQFDASKWKIVSVDWDEESGQGELEGNVTSIRFYMIDQDGKAWQQTFIASLGWKAGDLDETPFAKGDKLDNPKDYPALDLEKLSGEQYTKMIEDAKAMLPKGYKYKSLDMFSINTYDKDPISFTLNVVEDGKETVSNAGRTSIVFYEVRFTADENGKLTMKE